MHHMIFTPFLANDYQFKFNFLVSTMSASEQEVIVYIVTFWSQVLVLWKHCSIFYVNEEIDFDVETLWLLPCSSCW